jgi:hypothetical protein
MREVTNGHGTSHTSATVAISYENADTAATCMVVMILIVSSKRRLIIAEQCIGISYCVPEYMNRDTCTHEQYMNGNERMFGEWG